MEGEGSKKTRLYKAKMAIKYEDRFGWVGKLENTLIQPTVSSTGQARPSKGRGKYRYFDLVFTA